jgi:high-affinity nickel-transport protein
VSTSTVVVDEIESGRWSSSERARIAAILGVIAALHIAGLALYLLHHGNTAGAGGLLGSGVVAYVLGMRHAFDADHIAAIDDTTRVMLLRGRRPVGVGFFFAMGHSTVVVLLALVVAVAAGRVSEAQVESWRALGGSVAVVVAMTFLLVVALLNTLVLTSLVRLWRGLRRGDAGEAEIGRAARPQGVLTRLLAVRLRGVTRHSWHMYPIGLLMGLGMETASEVTLLSLSASTAAGGRLPIMGVLSLPLLFAAGMSTFDTADSLIMTRLYSWSYRDPVRTLFFNIATTAMTVAIALFIALVYSSQVLAEHAGWTVLDGVAAISEHFQVFGYGIALIFAVTWGSALLIWRRRAATLRPAAATVGISAPGGDDE